MSWREELWVSENEARGVPRGGGGVVMVPPKISKSNTP